jgi:hypothetical protein
METSSINSEITQLGIEEDGNADTWSTDVMTLDTEEVLHYYII